MSKFGTNENHSTKNLKNIAQISLFIVVWCHSSFIVSEKGGGRISEILHEI